jgi:competence protein ComGC
MSKLQHSHPIMNTIMLGISTGLMTISAISGFISYGKLGSDPGVSGTKKMLLFASTLSLFSVILLGMGIFLVHRYGANMRGVFGITLSAMAAVLMLISGILYAAAVAKINKQKYSGAHTAAVLSTVSTFSGMALISVLFLLALLALHGKQQVVTVRPSDAITKTVLVAPQNSAVELKQLQTEFLRSSNQQSVGKQ